MQTMLDVKVPMRDGTLLSMNVFRPDSKVPYPTILLRTPYIKENIKTEWLYANYEELAATGYNVAFQDVRGTGMSQGVLVAHGGNEVDDGYDTVEWISRQLWCDGRVGMFGLSYFGYSQLAAAQNHPPHLVTICPFQNSAVHPFSITKANTFGHFHLRWLYGRALDSLERSNMGKADKERISGQIAAYTERWDEMVFHLPARENPAAQVEGVPLLNDFVDLVDGVEDSAYWHAAHRPIQIGGIDMPMLFLTGWFDVARDGTFDNYRDMMMSGTAVARRDSRLIVGPWVHGGGLATQLDGLDFGVQNSGEGRGIRPLMRQWFDHWIKQLPGCGQEAPVSVFVLGDNCWRDEQEWPPKRAVSTPWYLRGGEDSQYGALSVQPAGDETPDRYVYDPANPQPSGLCDAQGRTLFADPSYLDARDDVLVYTSQPLAAAMEVTGCVHLKLFASTDVTDTDFFARLCDVDESGRAFPLLDGIVRGRFRSGRASSPLTPGEIYELDIELGNISNVFMAGHQMKLTVSSSSFPAHDRNLNTGVRTGWGDTWIVANQSIYHDAAHPSCLLLPVIPR